MQVMATLLNISDKVLISHICCDNVLLLWRLWVLCKQKLKVAENENNNTF